MRNLDRLRTKEEGFGPEKLSTADEQ